MAARTLEQIDAELTRLRAQKEKIQEQLRALIKEREAYLALVEVAKVVEKLSPEQRKQVAHEISAIGIPSGEKFGG